MPPTASLLLLLSLSDTTTGVRDTFLLVVAQSLDPERIALQPRELGNASRATLDALSEKCPVVEVEWVDPLHATIRAALAERVWTTRTLTFAPEDPMAERAKALGFSVAAMWPQWRPVHAVEDAPVPEVTALSVDDLGPGEGAAGHPVAEVAVGPSPAAPAPPPEASTTTNTEQDRDEGSRVHGRVALSALVSAPVTVGGSVDVMLCWPSHAWCAGLAGHLSRGDVAAIEGFQLWSRVMAFAELTLMPWGQLGLRARLGLGALYWSITRMTETASQWAPTGLVEAGPIVRWGRFDLSLSGGVAVASPAKVWVGSTQLVEIGPFSGLFRLGLGASW